MENTTYKTGESVPEDGTYKVVSRVDGGELNKDDTEIMIEKGQKFPNSPSTDKEANWTKA
ncbi:YjzC family protein [Halobacillus sp. K22]|uniref:YjzC family protein n=1 Tax=Halobacillus sp. K22 TaxID=3457431 RepID=UPI003FCE2017